MPGLNELIASAKAGHGRGNSYSRLKAQTEADIGWCLKRVRHHYTRVELRFLWVEPNRRRDPDNIAAGGRKLVLDAMVASGVLAGDGWKNVLSFSDRWVLAKGKEGVVVEIQQAEEPSADV